MNILYSESIVEPVTWFIVILTVTLFIFAFSFFGLMFSNGETETTCGYVLLLSLIVLVVFGVLNMFGVFDADTGKQQLYVTLNEGAVIDAEKYIIEDIKGDLYIINTKEEE